MARNWDAPADRGQPDPEEMAVYVMLIILVVLLVACIRVGIREEWFEPIIEFILS